MVVLASISESLVNETSHLVRTGGLPMIFVLMAVGSACIPVPSEVVMLFAGFAVADHTASGSTVKRMPIVRFTVLTTIGSLPWVLGLALAGHAVGGDWTSVRKGFEYVDYAVVALVVIGIVYLLLRRRRGRADSGDPAPDAAA